MPTIIIRLNPELLQNPDADLRYALPDLIAERSCGLIEDEGYDYVGPYLLLFLATKNVDQGVLSVLGILENEKVLGNELLPACVVAIDHVDYKEVVFPTNFQGPFPE